MNTDELRQWLSAELDRRGMTQVDLANRLNMHSSVFSRLLSGERDISYSDFANIVSVLGQPPRQLFDRSLENDGHGEQSLRHLGGSARIPEFLDAAVLERVANPHPDTHYVARFTAPEFTALCPMTGQPDFAHLVIDYVPKAWLVESKSLKLYLASFRNHGSFHEDCTVAIGKRLTGLLEPHFLRIGGYWYPRGGMPIDVFWQTGKAPAGVWLPDQGVAPYRGRG